MEKREDPREGQSKKEIEYYEGFAKFEMAVCYSISIKFINLDKLCRYIYIIYTILYLIQLH